MKLTFVLVLTSNGGLNEKQNDCPNETAFEMNFHVTHFLNYISIVDTKEKKE